MYWISSWEICKCVWGIFPPVFSEILIMKVPFIKGSKIFNVVKDIKAAPFQEITCTALLCCTLVHFLQWHLRHQNWSQMLLGGTSASQRRGFPFLLLAPPHFLRLPYSSALARFCSWSPPCWPHDLLGNMRPWRKRCQFVRKEAQERCVFRDKSRSDTENTAIDKSSRKMKK